MLSTKEIPKKNIRSSEAGLLSHLKHSELQGTKFVQLQFSVLVAVGVFVFKVLHVMRPFIRHKRTSAADKWMS